MGEENQINDAEVEAIENEANSDIQKTKTDFYVEIALILILGFLVGIAVKTEAEKRITMGFDDYKLNFSGQNYSINKLETELVKNAENNSGESEVSADDQLSGGSCGQ